MGCTYLLLDELLGLLSNGFDYSTSIKASGFHSSRNTLDMHAHPMTVHFPTRLSCLCRMHLILVAAAYPHILHPKELSTTISI